MVYAQTPPPAEAALIDALLGRTETTLEMDTNRDGQVDMADLVAEVRLRPNDPPVMDPIEPQTVALGDELGFMLGAMDPNGDSIGFGALTLPLPDGAALDSMSGVFTFRPGVDQVGELQITFFAVDGRGAIATQTVSITVTGPEPGATTSISLPSICMTSGWALSFWPLTILVGPYGMKWPSQVLEASASMILPRSAEPARSMPSAMKRTAVYARKTS